MANPYASSRPAVISGAHAQTLLLEITGDKQMINRISKFRESGMRRVMVAGMRATVKESAKYLKSVAPRKDIKDNIGWTATRLSSPTRAVAKAGINVGKRPLRFRKSDEALVDSGNTSKQQMRKIKKAQKSGYGVPALVWVVLGTVMRRTRTGANRGRMSATFSVQQSMAPGKDRVMAAARKASNKQIEKEMAKMKS